MPNLLVTMPAHDGRNATWTTESLIRLARHVDFEFKALNHKESFLYRQLCIEEFVSNQSFTHWLSIDSDMGFSCKVVDTLLQSGKDFICAIAFCRKIPGRLAYVALNEGPSEPYRIIEIKFAGLALALVSRAAVNRLEKTYPKTMQLNSVRGEKTIHHWFEPISARGVYLEPDYSFQERYRNCGGKIWGFYPGNDVMHH